MTRSACAAIALILITNFSAAAEVSHHQGETHATEAKAAIQYPQIVLYSVVWCPHCRETKEYLKKNDIPFINRDVELDTKAMDDLTIKYNSTRVPLIVFGKGADEIVMKGFTPELFQETLQKARVK